MRLQICNDAIVANFAWSEGRKVKLPDLPEAPQAPPKGSSGPGAVWVVVGGSDGKGILVRSGVDLKSSELGRLAYHAKIAEVEENGDRVHYKKLEGEGPESGWVSKTLKGSKLIR